MKPILTHLFSGLFLLLVSQAFGQPSMTTNFVVTTPPSSPQEYPIGTHIVVELRVDNFTNIESMQFPIVYNKDAMKFDSLTDAVFSNWNAGNFTNLTAGKIGISWDGYSNGANSPFSFPNGTALFKLHFTVTGNGLSTVTISPTAAPPAIDVAGNGGATIVLNYQGGGTPTITLGTGNPPPPPLVGFKIVANTIYIPQGERGCMPVTVNDFDDIVSMQYAMHWSNSVLNFECTRAYNLPGWSATDFNSTYATGTLLCGWADPAGAGVDRADGVRIVDVCFKAIGAPGTNTTVTIDGVGFPPGNGHEEAYNANSVDVWQPINHTNGYSGVSAPINVIVTPPSPNDVTITVETLNVPPSTQGCVSVKVKNFTAITNTEFALSYNMAELTYNNYSFGANPLNLQAANITHVPNIPAPGTGVVKFIWANTNGVTVPNDATIFSLCFTPVVSLPVGQTSNINFTTTACPTITGIGVAKATGGVPVARVNGGVKVVQTGPDLTPTAVTCFGMSNGSIALTNPPASVPTGYLWSNGATVEDPTGLPAGTYTVTVTYSGGSTGTNTAIVTQPSAAITETHTVNTVSCFGGSNGAINLTVSGGNTGGYTYLWSPGGSTAEDPTGLAAGNYTVVIKDNKNCTLNSPNISITGPQQITLPNGNQTITNVTCSGLANGSIAITPTGGAGGYTYDWSHNGAQTPDTDPKDLVGMPSGTYTVTVTDANGCTAVLPTSGQGISITAPPALITNLDSKSDVKCMGSTNGCASISVNGGTGPYSYCWNSGSSCVATIEDPCTLPAGSFNVVITDQKGCTSTLPQNVNIAAPTGGAIQITPASTPSACFDTPTGTITMAVNGGWSNFTYAWNPTLSAISNPTNVAPGTYTLTATDGGQCTATASVTVTGATAITNGTTIEHVTCNGLSDGSIDLNLAGGSPGYTVVWSNTPKTGEVITDLAPGAYQPTITDNNGCSKILSPITVNGIAPITQATMVQHVTCYSQDNGGIDLNLAGGTPGYTVVWSNTVLTGEAISNLEPGAYQPTVTDDHGCTQVFPAITVTEPGELFFSEVITETNPTGAIDLTYVSGGTPSFTYLWSNGATTQDVNNLATGTFTVTITDANLCPRSFTYVVPEGNVFSTPVTVFATANTCDHDGQIILNLPQAAATQMPFTLNWGTGPQGPYNTLMPVIDNLSAGVYSVTVTAANGNTAVVTNVTIAQKEPASVNSNTQNPFDANQNGKIILSVAPGVTGPLTYQWGAPLNTTGPIVSNLDSGCYTVTITNTNPLSGCTAVQTFCLEREYATLAFSATTAVTNPNCASSPTGKIIVVITGGNDPFLYNWVGPNGFTASTSTIQDLGPGTYNLTVTDENGTTLTNSWTLTNQSNIAITNVNETSLYNGYQVSSASACDGAASVVFIPGVGANNIQWSNGFTSANNTTLCAGAYSVTVTDAVGCSSVWSDALTAPDAVIISNESVGVSCHGDCNGSAKVYASGGAAPYKMQWSTGQLDQAVQAGQFSQAINLCGGEYLVTITDKNGLQTVYSLEVQEPDEITAIFAPTTPRSFNACDGQMVVALTGAVAPVEYLWSSDNHAISTDTRYENLCSGELIYLSITDANGCTLNTFDTIPYPEDGCFRVSPVLTPGQQDGKNDNVHITCIETALENHIEIYNRWGQLVFQADDYTNEDTDRDHNWNGLTSSGAALAEGVYYYVLTYTFVDDQANKQEGIRKGAINLLR